MIILPAIDIKGGTCVRLYQGRFDTAEKVADSALGTARSFEAAGARWIHMVDLDGALNGMALNAGIFMEVAKRTGLKVELGGGIRTLEQIHLYLNAGIHRVVLGSIAIENPGFVRSAIASFGEDAIAVGIDAKGGMVCGSGWTETSAHHYVDFAQDMAKMGVKTLIYTNISRDGTLSGVALDDMRMLKEAVPNVQLIASGGVSNLDDIRVLKELDIYGVICGKAIYEGSLSLNEAIALAQEEGQ